LKIAHLGDIHIHSFQRHDQYRKAFSALYEKLEEIKPDIIVIAGDIAHNKTELSPEFISVYSEFLLNLSERTNRVDIIIGNHDGNIKNKNRENAISPIINLINKIKTSNITIFEKSGIYDIDENFRYAVYSIFDEENFPKVEKSNKTTIALYHGIVNDCIAENSFSLKSDITLEMFKGCDYGLLGDVHKQQAVDKDGRFRYCGSFIQQNMGESLEKGFLVWDIKNKNEFSVKKENIIVDGLICFLYVDKDLNITKASSAIVDRSIIRLYYDPLVDKKALHEFSEQLFKKYNALDVKCIKNIQKDKNNQAQVKNEISFSLEKYISDKKEISKELVDNLIKIDRDIQTKLDSGLFANRGLIWEIEELEWSNLFAYGEDNRIDFTKLNGITGILGENRLGKSSIIDIILWTIFNESSKKTKKASWIIHHGTNQARSKIKITTNSGDIYTIERKISGGKKKDGSSTSVNFDKITNGVTISLNGIDRVETDKNIRQIFGTFDNFIMTSLAPSGMMNNFVKNIDSERLNILSTFLGADIFKAKYKIAKDQSDELKTFLKGFKEVNFDKEIFEAKSNIAIQETYCSSSINQITEVKSELDKNIQEIYRSKSMLVADIEIIDINILESAKKKLDSYLSEQELLLDVSCENYGKYIGSIFSYNETVESIVLDDSIDTSCNSINKNIDSTNLLIVNLSNQERILSSSVSILDDIKCENRECVFIKDAFSKKDDLTKIQFDKNEKVKELNIVLQNKVNIESAYNENKKNKIKKEELEKSIKNFSNLLSKNMSEMLKLKESIMVSENKLKTIIEKIEVCKKNRESIERNKKIKEEIDLLEINEKSLKQTLLKLEDKYQSYVESLGAAKSMLETITETKFKYFDSRKKYDAYEKYLELTSRNGIPLEIIIENLSAINDEIQNILVENNFDFGVSLEENEDKSGIDLFLKKKDQKYHLELESGAEEGISSIAIRLALISICTLPKLDAFIIDESFGAFDTKLLPMFSGIFEYIRKMFKNTVIISHISHIKELCDSQIEIQRKDGESKVCC
jgi:DNA repair exonuclease SbcCD ATPase subunit/DNA repair exonuclease SbcCD nuclease subunit